MASKVINTILNLKDNFSDTIQNVAKNTQGFKSGMKDTEDQAIKMKKTVNEAFSTIKESMLRGIGFGAGMDIWENMKEGIVETVTLGNELQKSLNGVMASSGLAETGMDRMKNIMLDIYNDNFGDNFDDIGEALKDVGQQTGYTGDDLKELTENAMALKDTFGYEVGESVRSASTLMKQFGVDGDEAFNLIAQGKQDGLDFSGEMLDSINEYSVQFKKLGLNAEDMFNILSAGSQEGAFNLDKVGDAVKEFSIRAIDGSKTTTDGFTQLGFNANDLADKFSQGGDIAKDSFEDVITALSNMKDPLKQSQVGVELFGTQFEDLGIDAIESLGNIDGEISNTYDALGQINKVKYNDIGSAFEGIKRNIQTSVLIPISDAVLPHLNDFANWFSSNIPNIKQNISGVAQNFLNIASSIGDKVWPSISNLTDSVSNLAKTIYDSIIPAFDSVKPDKWNSVGDAVKNIIDKATGVVNFINNNWNTIGPIVGGITDAVISWKLAIMAVNTWAAIVSLTTSAWGTIELTIWGIRNATTVWEAAQWALNVAMDANPVGVVCLAIGALILVVYEIITHFQDLCTWVSNAWDFLKNNPIAAFVLDCIPFVNVLYEIAKHWDDIVSGIKSAWDWLTKWNGTKSEDKTINVTTVNSAVSAKDNNDTSGFSPEIVDDSANNATGTQYWSGGRTWVGEHGKEIVDLPSGSKVYTASQSKKMLSNNGGISVSIVVQGNMIGNEEYANYMGNHIANRILTQLSNM
jgi:TP901 family phage tail tape measure protein